jgi:hypothetical protein
MSTRLLHFRLAFALLAVVALVSGALLETVWLAGPGAVAAAISDLIGLLQARARFNLPVERAFRGASEALPALGVAAFEPYAMGVTIAVVIFALMANGMETVKLASRRDGSRQTGEMLRRLLTALAGLSLLWIPVEATSDFSLGSQLGVSAWLAAGIAFLVAGGGGLIAVADSLISVKGKGEGSSAPNVDT